MTQPTPNTQGASWEPGSMDELYLRVKDHNISCQCVDCARLDMDLVSEELKKQKGSWESRVDYNAHDMGELGMFIRVDYAKNILREIASKERAEGEKRERERILAGLPGERFLAYMPGSPFTLKYKEGFNKCLWVVRRMITTLPADSTEGV